MKAMILAAGEGTRLRPLTHYVPKAMVPVANRPVMAHVLTQLARHGLNEVIVNLHHMPEVIPGYFGDGSAFGVKLTYVREDQLWGTAGSVKRAADFFDDETFLVTGVDDLADVDLSYLLARHRGRRALATIGLAEVDDPSGYGIVATDAEGRITRFFEKPAPGEAFSNTANTMIYFFEPEILDLIPPGEIFDFARDLFPRLLAQELPFFGFISPGYWLDIGSLSDYLRAQSDLLSGRTSLPVPGTQRQPGVWVGEGSVIAPTAELVGPACIGDGSRLEEGVRIEAGTVIGNRCRIGAGARLRASVVWDGVEVPAGEILEREVRIPGGAVKVTPASEPDSVA